MRTAAFLVIHTQTYGSNVSVCTFRFNKSDLPHNLLQLNAANDAVD